MSSFLLSILIILDLKVEKEEEELNFCKYENTENAHLCRRMTTWDWGEIAALSFMGLQWTLNISQLNVNVTNKGR